MLEEAANKIGFDIYIQKIKIMEIIERVEYPNKMKDLTYEKVRNFKFIGAKLSI